MAAAAAASGGGGKAQPPPPPQAPSGGGDVKGGGGKQRLAMQDSLSSLVLGETARRRWQIPHYTCPPLSYRGSLKSHTGHLCISIPRTAFVVGGRSFGDFDVRGDHKEVNRHYEQAVSFFGYIAERLYGKQLEEIPRESGDDDQGKRNACSARLFMEVVHAKPPSQTDAVNAGEASPSGGFLARFLHSEVERHLRGGQDKATADKYDPDKIVLLRLHLLYTDNTIKKGETSSFLDEFVAGMGGQAAPVPPPPSSDKASENGGGGGEGGGEGEAAAKAPPRAKKQPIVFPYQTLTSMSAVIRALGVSVILAEKPQHIRRVSTYTNWVWSLEHAVAFQADDVCAEQADVKAYTLDLKFPFPELVAELDMQAIFPRNITRTAWWHLCKNLSQNDMEKMQFNQLMKSHKFLSQYLVTLRTRERNEIIKKARKAMDRSFGKLQFSNAVYDEFDNGDAIWNTPEDIWDSINSSKKQVEAAERPLPQVQVPPPPEPGEGEEEEDQEVRIGGGVSMDGEDVEGAPPLPSVSFKHAVAVAVAKSAALSKDETWASERIPVLFKLTDAEKKARNFSDEELKLNEAQRAAFHKYFHSRYIKDVGAAVYGGSEATFNSLAASGEAALLKIDEEVDEYRLRLLAKAREEGVEETPADIDYNCEQFRAHCMNDYRERSLKVFEEIIDRDGKISDVARTIFSWGRQYLQTHKNFSCPHEHVLPPVSDREGMSTFAAFIVSFMRDLNHTFAFLKTQSLALMVFACGLHAYSKSGFHPNMILDGEYSSGKSYAVDWIQSCFIPGTVSRVAHMTSKSNTATGDHNDRITVMHEVPPVLLGISKNKDTMDPQTSMMKTAVTEGVIETKSILIDPDTGQRKSVDVKCECEGVFIFLGNFERIHIIPPAIRSRYFIVKTDRMGMDSIKSVNLRRAPPDVVHAVEQNMRRLQYLTCMVFKLIQSKVLKPVNLDAARHFYGESLTIAASKDLGSATEHRNTTRNLFLCEVFTILAAISEHFDMYGSPISSKPWRLSHILGIEPRLVCTIEIAAFVLRLTDFQFEHVHRQTVVDSLDRNRFPGDRTQYFRKVHPREAKAVQDPVFVKQTEVELAAADAAKAFRDDDEDDNVELRVTSAVPGSSSSSSKKEKKSRKGKDPRQPSITNYATARYAEVFAKGKKRDEMYMITELDKARKDLDQEPGESGPEGEWRPGAISKRNQSKAGTKQSSCIGWLTNFLHQVTPSVPAKDISDVLHALHNEYISIDMGNNKDGVHEWTFVRALDFYDGNIKCATRLFDNNASGGRLDTAINQVLSQQFRVPRRLLTGKLIPGSAYIFGVQEFEAYTGVTKRIDSQFMHADVKLAMHLSRTLSGSKQKEKAAAAAEKKKNQKEGKQPLSTRPVVRKDDDDGVVIVKQDMDDYSARLHLKNAGWQDVDVLVSHVGFKAPVMPTEYLTFVNDQAVHRMPPDEIERLRYPDADIAHEKQARIRYDRMLKEQTDKTELFAKVLLEEQKKSAAAASSSSSSSSSATTTRPAIRRKRASPAEAREARVLSKAEAVAGRISSTKRLRLESMFKTQ